MRVVLGSASPARLATLRAAGVEPEVIISGVDEDNVTAKTPADLAGVLATLKGDAVAAKLSRATHPEPAVVIGCDSVFEFEGQPLGKPGTPDIARIRARHMRGGHGVLHTGHRVIFWDPDLGRSTRATTEVASTDVWFGDPSDDELDAYIATGEPLQVAGGFTIDGLGGPFIERILGDHHNVVGISLPLLRRILASWGISWYQLRLNGPVAAD